MLPFRPSARRRVSLASKQFGKPGKTLNRHLLSHFLRQSSFSRCPFITVSKHVRGGRFPSKFQTNGFVCRSPFNPNECGNRSTAIFAERKIWFAPLPSLKPVRRREHLSVQVICVNIGQYLTTACVYFPVFIAHYCRAETLTKTPPSAHFPLIFSLDKTKTLPDFFA